MNQPLKQMPSLRDRIVEVLREHHEVKHIGALADKLEAALPAAEPVTLKTLKVIANYENQATLDENAARIMMCMAKAALSPDTQAVQDRIDAAMADRARELGLSAPPMAVKQAFIDGFEVATSENTDHYPDLTSHEVDFCILVLCKPSTKLNGEGEALHWEDDGSEFGKCVAHWDRPEKLGLVECVGSYKWVPTDKLKSILRSALSAQVQDVATPSPINALFDMLGALENARDLLEYGGFDLEKIDRAISTGRVMTSGKATPSRQSQDLNQLEIRLQELIAEKPTWAQLAAIDDHTRMWFVSELISHASGRVPLLEIEGLVSRKLAAVAGGEA